MLQEGKTAKTTVCDRSGDEFLKAQAKCSGDFVKITFSGANPEILLANIFDIEALSGAEMEKTEKGILLKGTESEISFKIL